MLHLRRWLLLTSVFALSAVSSSAQQPGEMPISIGVSPPRFELEIDDGPMHRAMRVYNFGSDPAEIRVSVHNWTLDPNNQVELLPPDEQSLDQWLVINPIAFTVPPGEFQTVRFAVRPKVEPAPGEHRAILYFTQLPKAQPASIDGMQVIGRLGAAVYGYVGDVERTATLHSVLVDVDGNTPVARFDVASAGSAHVRLQAQYTVWPADSYPGAANTVGADATQRADIPLPEGAVANGWLPRLPVLPGQRRVLGVPVPERLEPGRYVLDIDGEVGGASVDIGVPFSVAESSGSDATPTDENLQEVEPAKGDGE